MALEAVTRETFEAEVLLSRIPVVVDFWAPWCGPCAAVEAVLEELAEKHRGHVRFVRVNVDENAALAARYRVLVLPTAILFEGGDARDVVVGSKPRAHFEAGWARWLSSAGE